MKITDHIIVKNYKCFDKNGAGFNEISPINLIIGKNNSGKSSLIDLIHYVIAPNKDFISKGRDNTLSEVIIEHRITDEEISWVFAKGTTGGGIPGYDHYEYGKNFIGSWFTYEITENNGRRFISLDTKFIPDARSKFENLASSIKPPFKDKIFCNIAAERDILPEKTQYTNVNFSPNGSGATNYIQQIVNRSNNDSSLIEKELLNEMNLIINPDVQFTRILVQQNPNEFWEVFFEDAFEKRIALSKMGSGIKTIILVLLNLIVRPKFENKSPENYVFAFEELENNLHPSLQRRLYNYIRSYSENHSSYFFLTTHSNVVIDSFGTYKNSQLIHVTHNGDRATSSNVISYDATKDLLNDLGIKASDLLQSNGVIWVEGPSDRNYLNKWIQILAPDLLEGLHYSIMFYGGRLLSNLTFDFEWFNKDVIPLLKINSNSFVILDRDGKTMSTRINKTKKRITSEIGDSNWWITRGREIENYISDTIVSKWLYNHHNYNVRFRNDMNQKFEDNILKSNDSIKLKYNLSKTVYSSEITDYMDFDSINVLDLKDKLYLLIEKIRKWNK